MRKLSDAPTGAPGPSGAEPGRAATPANLESPSLFGPQSAGKSDPNSPTAYELKFLLPEEQARAVAQRLDGKLATDPHADPALGGAYRTTSIYTDTPRFDVFRRTGIYAGTKFRARRYGGAGPVFLERKDKDGDRVWKCRATIPADELGFLGQSSVGSEWVGEWFHHQLASRELRPVCRVSYERLALMGPTEAGVVRVTFDRNIRGEAVNGWDLSPVGQVPELLPGFVVCEFKFRVALPNLLKELVESFGLAPATVSKYRRFMKAAGLIPEGANPAHGEHPEQAGSTPDA